jgi:hypothetical protein
MLIEQQHRIAQLEEELNRSRAEVCTPPLSLVVPFLSFLMRPPSFIISRFSFSFLHF